MERIMKQFIKVFLVASLFTSSYAAEKTPVGYWKTIDDHTGRTKSIIQIYHADNDTLMGKVIKIYPGPGKTEKEVCIACKGEKLNQPIVGMVILSGLRAAENQWDKGQILDPENGKTYSCSVKVGANGNQLKVKGYIGLPIIGRSQTWERVDVMSASG